MGKRGIRYDWSTGCVLDGEVDDGCDWLSPHSCRTPDEYPYSFSEHFLWREFERGDSNVSASYTDRMREWDREKYKRATLDGARMENYGSRPRSRVDAQRVVEEYFGPEYVCVGFLWGCNQSNGYPLGAFYYRKKACE